MEIELSALEAKIRQTLDLCLRLRQENQELRQQLADSESARRGLAEKIDGARTRLEGLLQRIPD